MMLLKIYDKKLEIAKNNAKNLSTFLLRKNYIQIISRVYY